MIAALKGAFAFARDNASGIIFALVVTLLGVQTVRLASANATIAKMETAKAKELADALAEQNRLRDADRRQNERLEADYVRTREDLRAANLRADNALSLAERTKECIVTPAARAVTDGLRARSAPAPLLPAGPASSSPH